jgi:uncharacterized protein
LTLTKNFPKLILQEILFNQDVNIDNLAKKSVLLLMKLTILSLSFLLIIFSLPPITTYCYCEEFIPWDDRSSNYNMLKGQIEYPITDISEAPFLILLKIYQQYISPIYGGHCVMYPSCSQYSVEAIKRNGTLIGIIMTAARLMHEADEQKISHIRFIDDRYKFLDPVEGSEFWRNN